MTMPLWFLIASLVIAAGGTAAGIYNQRSMLNDQQDFNSAEAEKARDWSSEGARYDRMTALGFNPDLAAASIMGNVQSVPYAASSPQAPNSPANLLSSVQAMLSQMPTDMMNYDKHPYEIQGLNLDNMVKQFEAGFKPMLLQQQLDYWDVYIDKLKTEHWISYENWKIVSAQAEYAKPLAAEQYFQAVATTNQIFALTDKYFSETLSNFADLDLKSAYSEYYRAGAGKFRSEISLNNTLEGLYGAQKTLTQTESFKTFMQGFNEFFDAKIRSLTGGLPIQEDVLRQALLLRSFDVEGSDSIVKGILKGERELYDFKIDNDWSHYWKNFLMGADLGDALNGVGVATGWYLGSRAGRGKPMSTSEAFGKYGNNPSPVVPDGPFPYKYSNQPFGPTPIKPNGPWSVKSSPMTGKDSPAYKKAAAEYAKHPTAANYWKKVKSLGYDD